MGLAAILGIALGARLPFDGTRYEVMAGSYGPQVEVRYARPTLKWEVWPTNPLQRFQGVEMRIDGKLVPATYDEGQRAILYTPGKPLSPGTHKVQCIAYMAKGARFEKAWESKISADALADLPAPLVSQVETLRAINELRKGLGLPSLSPDDRMNMAALQHSRYLARNQDFGHSEDPKKPGFFGATSADRLAVYGWVGGCYEDVSFGTSSAVEAVRELFDAPYHRIPFLQPDAIPCGTGFVDQRMTLEFGMSTSEATVVSPASGQEGVPVSWRNFERPDPLRMHGKDLGVTGYPIILAQFGSRPARLGSVRFAGLTGPNDLPVACWLNTPANDDALTCAAILIPKSPLKPNTTYRFTFVVTDADGRPVTTTGNFKTA